MAPYPFPLGGDPNLASVVVECVYGGGYSREPLGLPAPGFEPVAAVSITYEVVTASRGQGVHRDVGDQRGVAALRDVEAVEPLRGAQEHRPGVEGHGQVEFRVVTLGQGIRLEGVEAAIVAHESAGAYNPKVTGGVAYHPLDHVVGERAVIIPVVAVDFERVAVVAVETVLGGDPYVSQAVLGDRWHGRVGEPLLDTDVAERNPRLSAAGHPGERQGKQCDYGVCAFTFHGITIDNTKLGPKIVISKHSGLPRVVLDIFERRRNNIKRPRSLIQLF